MSEGHISAIVRSSDTELLATIQAFLESHTDGLNRQNCSDSLVELSGPFFDSWLEDKVDEFVSTLGAAAFARLIWSDEYGQEIFWVIDSGESSKFRLDEEEPSKRVPRGYEALHKGLGDIRRGVLTAVEVAEIKKHTDDPRTQQYMDVIFLPPVAKPLDRIEYKDGYLEPMSVQSDAKSTFGHWFPISRNKGKPPEGLIEQLLEYACRDFYAHTYRDGTRTQRILHCSSDGITELFSTDDYSDEELRYVREHADEQYGDIDWTYPSLSMVVKILENTTLRDYVEERVAVHRRGVAEERQRVVELRAANPGKQEPLLEGVDVYVFYKELDYASANGVATELQICGMELQELETGLAMGGANTVVVPAARKSAGEWLIANVEALSGHKLVVDNYDGPFDDPDDVPDNIVVNLS